MSTNHYEQHGIGEMRAELTSLLGRHVYLKMIGDPDPTPYQGMVESVAEATVVIVQDTPEIPGRPGNRLQDAEPTIPATRERSRLRIDRVMSVTEATVIEEADPDTDDDSADSADSDGDTSADAGAEYREDEDPDLPDAVMSAATGAAGSRSGDRP